MLSKFYGVWDILIPRVYPFAQKYFISGVALGVGQGVKQLFQ